MGNLKYSKVLVLGAGRSGVSAARLLQRQGASIILYDANTNLKMEDIKKQLYIYNNIGMVIGDLPEGIYDSIDLVVLSPGVPTDHIIVEEFIKRNVPIWGEIELAYSFSKGKVIGITGTNGKTTTTMLTGAILKTWFKEVFVVGNIGKPYTDIALETTERSVTVIELSSFQLDTIHTFRPDISALLNIAPDHLDRHHTLVNYIGAKENITKNQLPYDYCILNHEDNALRNIASRLQLKILYFSSLRRLDEGIYLNGDNIVYSHKGRVQLICNVHELKIIGTHNHENVMAAALIGTAVGIPIDCIRKAVKTFRAVPHRNEYVKTLNGVDYYNDSKGTNPDASIKAIMAIKKPIILIAGGYDKQIAFDDWIIAIKDKVRYMVLIGSTRERIAKTALRHGFSNVIKADSLKEAVLISASKATLGDVVLLSPACASFDMFDSFEHRGCLFKEYVRNMHK